MLSRCSIHQKCFFHHFVRDERMCKSGTKIIHVDWCQNGSSQPRFGQSSLGLVSCFSRDRLDSTGKSCSSLHPQDHWIPNGPGLLAFNIFQNCEIWNLSKYCKGLLVFNSEIIFLLLHVESRRLYKRE